ncbi:HDIG domain-containing metalloprotein [Methanolobus sp. ZRKC3]|uniref:HDIG domain-containing metalloprotein n=1 Tax=Methanolobus sp. ZRKC3 TaxID=3125786 RepID=UPI0032492807
MISRKRSLQILEEAGCSKGVIEHCIAVSELATEIGNKLADDGIEIDLALVEIGGLLHDIGRSKTHSIRHAVEGANIARKLQIDASIAEIIKRHIGAGITIDEILKFDLPEDNYMPETIEEKVVAHADNLIKGTERISLEERISLMVNGKIDGKAIKRVRALAEDIGFY